MKMSRWSAQRKHNAVLDIKAGLLDRSELMREHGISEEEMTEWERDAAHGLDAHRRRPRDQHLGKVRRRR